MTCPLSPKAIVQCAHIPSLSHEAEPTGKPPFVFLLHRFIGNPKSPLVAQPSWVAVISTVSGLFWGLNAPGSGLSHITSLSPLQRTVSNTSLKLAVEPAFAETVRAARAAAAIRVFFILGVPFRCGWNFSCRRCQVPPWPVALGRAPLWKRPVNHPARTRAQRLVRQRGVGFSLSRVFAGDLPLRQLDHVARGRRRRLSSRSCGAGAGVITQKLSPSGDRLRGPVQLERRGLAASAGCSLPAAYL
jgi:hypothetical protein